MQSNKISKQITTNALLEMITPPRQYLYKVTITIYGANTPHLFNDNHM